MGQKVDDYHLAVDTFSEVDSTISLTVFLEVENLNSLWIGCHINCTFDRELFLLDMVDNNWNWE